MDDIFGQQRFLKMADKSNLQIFLTVYAILTTQMGRKDETD